MADFKAKFLLSILLQSLRLGRCRVLASTSGMCSRSAVGIVELDDLFGEFGLITEFELLCILLIVLHDSYVTRKSSETSST